MNWNSAVEKNLEALRRILAMLVSLVQLADSGSAASGDGRSRTLPRHLHRYLLSLLRPAEAATRRLIIVAARGLVVKFVLPRPRKPKPQPEPRIVYVLDRINGSMVSVPIVLPAQAPDPGPARPVKRCATASFPLLDPLKRFGVRRRYAKPGALPQIRLLGGNDPIVPLLHQPKPLAPSPDDPLDATRIRLRIEAIRRVLDDLPGQANRMARWRARRDALLAEERERGRDASGSVEAAAQPRPRVQRLSPMRPGRPPGWQRKPKHDVHETLNELHGLAVWLRDSPDTS